MSAQIALKKAAEFAERFKGKVHAIYVKNNSKPTNPTIEKSVHDIGKAHGVEIEFIERKGKVYSEISSYERELGADLIIVGTHGNEGWQPFWLGSNAFRIVSAANCPAITIQEFTKDLPLQDIMLPIDDSDSTRQKVPYAAALAKGLHAKVHIYGVTQGSDNATVMRIKKYVEQTNEYLQKRGIVTTTKIDTGVKLVKSILDYRKETKAGLLMMMTDTETTGFTMGSYASDIVNNCQVPVMSIHSRDLNVSGAVGY